jgi:large subunit ribosomal protein L31
MSRARAVFLQAHRCVRAAAKPGIHPDLHTAKIVVNGEEVGEITGTQEEYHVDVWSGNHPFYKGNTGSLVMDEGQVRIFSCCRTPQQGPRQRVA